MSSHPGANVRPDVDDRASRRVNTETKASFKTTELIVYVLSVLGVLIASQVVNDGDFNAKEAWFFVTLLTIGYMVSRGLAKSGSRDFDDDRGVNHPQQTNAAPLPTLTHRITGFR